MKSNIATAFFIFSICSAFSQGQGRIEINLTPTALFNPHVATFMPGIEVSPFKNFSIGLDYGLKARYFAPTDWNSYRKNWDYHKYKIGGKYLFPADETLISYLELEYFGVEQAYRKLAGQVTRRNGQIVYFDSSNIQRSTKCLSLNFGLKWWFSGPFCFEFYCGGGWKWVTIDHVLFGTSTTPNSSDDFFNFGKLDNTEGTQNFPHLDFGIKFGVMLSLPKQTPPPSE
jgi:hypothetical protein